MPKEYAAIHMATDPGHHFENTHTWFLEKDLRMVRAEKNHRMSDHG